MLNKGDCSVDTVQRYIKNAGLRNGQGETLIRERRTWEFAHSCDGYEADTCHGFYIYDEEYEAYLCDMNMDEDDYVRILSDRYYQCPYYRDQDEYAVVRKQM